jgi:ubiquitin C-terminal hydrolase
MNNEIVLGLNGLQNIGNTCYLNTILQCLSNCKLFREYLINKKEFVEPLAQNIMKENANFDTDEIYNEFNNKLTYQLFRVIKALWKESNCVLTPSSFKKLLGKKLEIFSGYAQNDTHEALTGIFGIIDTELNIKQKFNIPNISVQVCDFITKKHHYYKLLNNENISNDEKKIIISEYDEYKKSNLTLVRIVNAYKSWKIFNENNKNVIIDVFTGYYHIETTCPLCNNKTDKFESFNCLEIPIETQNNLDISDCLNNFYKLETLDNENKLFCDECKIKVNASRKIYIWKKPKILIILFKRFDYLRRIKKCNTILFPINDFDMNSYISPLAENITDNKYNLIAIGNHHGNMNFGHYYAYCLNNDNWYEFNDSSVSRKANNNIVTNSAYLLFYELN